MRKVVFLDRDGVINKKAPEHDYVRKWQEFEFLPDVVQAVKELHGLGYVIIIATNQRGIARGLMTEDDLKQIHGNMQNELARQGAKIDAIYVCPHDKNECECRKPKPGLLLQAERDLGGIDKQNSWLIGDGQSDIETGKRYGIKTILVRSESDIKDDFGADAVCKDLPDAARYLAANGAIVKG